MKNVLHIHSDNIERFRNELALSIAVIGRPDSFMTQNEAAICPLIVETPHGTHLRCYRTTMCGVNVLVVYGRFDKIRTQSSKIDFQLTQHTINYLGITKIVGLFVAGSICQNVPAGSIYIPHDFVGLGGYQQSMAGEQGFRNVDMFNPFCNTLRTHLVEGSTKRELDFQFHSKGIYACFHGYPRIETRAELEFYSRNGWDVVGQTLDPEATLAREAGCHYAAIVATIDDWKLRERFLNNDRSAREDIDANIKLGRERAFSILVNSLPSIDNMRVNECGCEAQGAHVRKRSKHFYYRPKYLCD